MEKQIARRGIAPQGQGKPPWGASAAPPRNDVRGGGFVPVTVGQAVTFDPFVHIQGYGVADMRERVDGIVVMVNPKHRMFTVEYGDPPALTSFNFFDIGKEVHLKSRRKS